MKNYALLVVKTVDVPIDANPSGTSTDAYGKASNEIQQQDVSV